MSLGSRLRRAVGTQPKTLPVTQLGPTAPHMHCTVVCRVVKSGELLRAMHGDRSALEWRAHCRARSCDYGAHGDQWTLVVHDASRHAARMHSERNAS